MHDQVRLQFLPDICGVASVLILVLVAELLALLLVLAANLSSGWSWMALAQNSLFCQWVVLSSAAFLCLCRPWLARYPLVVSASFSFLLILLIAACTSLAGQWLWHAADARRIDPRLTVDHLLMAAILAGIALRYLYLQQQLQQQQEAELRARIDALQARIRPHFLFNSMNSIASLIASDPVLAEQVVVDLAALFRQGLATDRTEVTLIDEIQLCRRFERIERLRLGSRLEVEWDTRRLPADLKIPRFTLQPLLENAIYHGVQPLVGKGLVRVIVRYDGGYCSLRVVNPIAEVNPEIPMGKQGNRMALENIRNRLLALYGPKSELKVKRDIDQFEVNVRYPYSVQQAPAA